MKPIRDPEGAEISHLIAACDLKDKTVLEIGCGDGYFTRQFSHLTGKTIGIDPMISDLNVAMQDEALVAPRVGLLQAEGERLPFESKSIDVALFACSL